MMKALMRRAVAFVRRHKRTEEEIAEAAGIAVAWRLAVAAVFGAGVASAAVLAPGLVDLSNNNGPAAAAVIRAPGTVAIEAKATEGLGFQDRDYPGFRAEAARRGRVFGGYMFLHPGLSGAAQARYFLAYARPKPGDLQPVVDSETGSPAAAAPATYAALHELERNGYRPILYASTSYLAGLVAADRRIARFRVWQAEYGPVLHHVPGTTTVAWQFTDRARVNGFSVDGSHLLVRKVAQLAILKPAGKRPKPPAPMSAKALRAKTGYWAWLSWRLGEGPWKHYTPGAPAVRPHVPAKIPARWWRNERAYMTARKGA